MTYKVDDLFLKGAQIKSNSLKINLLGRGAKSLKICKAAEDQELVDNALDWIINQPEIGVCYAIIMGILGLLGTMRKSN